MNEVDDRLAGDPVWELFPAHLSESAPGSHPVGFLWWLAVACVVAASLVFSPSLAVLIASLAIAAGDLLRGRQLARSIPDKAGGTICSRFTYAWGAWKAGLVAFAFLLMIGILGRLEHEVPPGFFVSLLLFLGGYSLSAILTASGLVRAYRSGMRVWVGQGVNQARTLLLGMLIMVFAVAVLGPICLWLAVGIPHAGALNDSVAWVMGGGFLGLIWVSPVGLLLILDWVCRHVVADRPGKFGPKVPAVGKWNS
jgi:hypothetical protein